MVNYKLKSKIKKRQNRLSSNIHIPVPKSGSKYPTYISGYLNDANKYSWATRPMNVGQLTEIFQSFIETHPIKNRLNVDNWEKYYNKVMPGAIENSTNILYKKVKQLSSGTMMHNYTKITKQMIGSWVRDLVINKTFDGLCMQKPIFEYLSNLYNKPYRLSTSKEESKGIDGYIGREPISIKPLSYDRKNLKENINVRIIRYQKINNKIHIHL